MPKPAAIKYRFFAGVFDGWDLARYCIYMKIFSPVFLVALLAVFLVFSGCSVTQQMDVKIDGSGEVVLTVEMGRVFQDYYRDLSGSEPNSPIFAPAEIRSTLQSQAGITVRQVREPQPGKLSITLGLQDVGQLYRDENLDVPQVISFTRAGNIAALNIRVGRDDIPRFLALSPVGDSPMIAYLLPPVDQMSRDEYIEFVGWALEEYEGETPVADLIAGSRLELRVVPGGELVSQRGGLMDGNAVVFAVPLVDLILAEDDYEFELRFRADEAEEN
ncbi:MAG: hypothetical protein D6B26_07420 [Spirochaetaceae bacterium]|nr:MAG: hypothetical protein D6B26_07420 [Spirochaetaceae bacterium]